MLNLYEIKAPFYQGLSSRTGDSLVAPGVAGMGFEVNVLVFLSANCGCISCLVQTMQNFSKGCDQTNVFHWHQL